MAKYQFKPMLFLTLFVIAEAAVYFFNVGLFNYVPALHPGLKSISILGAVAAIFLGYITASIMVWSATGSLKLHVPHALDHRQDVQRHHQIGCRA